MNEALPIPHTICIQCRYFLDVSEGVNTNVWYHNFCAATPHRRWIDPVTGEETTANGRRYAYCRDVNDGDCPKYNPVVMTEKGKSDDSTMSAAR